MSLSHPPQSVSPPVPSPSWLDLEAPPPCLCVPQCRESKARQSRVSRRQVLGEDGHWAFFSFQASALHYSSAISKASTLDRAEQSKAGAGCVQLSKLEHSLFSSSLFITQVHLAKPQHLTEEGRRRQALGVDSQWAILSSQTSALCHLGTLSKTPTLSGQARLNSIFKKITSATYNYLKKHI